MTEISIYGAGAFGTALAISLARDGNSVQLVARSEAQAIALNQHRENTTRLAGHPFPTSLTITADATDPALICLVAIPTRHLSGFIRQHRQEFIGRTVIACCKGVDLETGQGPTGVILQECPSCEAAILSGPSFATDIAAGLPTALTLAARTDEISRHLQQVLASNNLRLYRSTDLAGVELGGALKNVIAIAAGITIGAGLGESARAALITRGYSEMKRFAQGRGAQPQTLSGLSGFGDLVLTCTSEKSRNFAHGLALGRSEKPAKNVTIEGIFTARAVAKIAKDLQLAMPVTLAVADLLEDKITIPQAVNMLLSRPLKKE